jgi:hypothetical protein
MMRLALGLALLLLSGCTVAVDHAGRALADADARATQGDYPSAIAAYDAYVKRYPYDDGVPRARAMRTMMAELVAMRAEVASLRDQLAKARGDTTEVGRLRQELSARQAEVTRLREDLEALKRTDLEMERRRR